MKSNKNGKNSYKELKNSQYIVHYKMVQYKYSTGNLPVPSQDEVKPQTHCARN